MRTITPLRAGAIAAALVLGQRGFHGAMQGRRLHVFRVGPSCVSRPDGCGNRGPGAAGMRSAGPAGRRTTPTSSSCSPTSCAPNMCSVYGGRNITTPNIDRLASEGVVFTNSVSTCPLCTPYRGMLQTGRYPTHSGIIINFVEASPAQNPHCLADVFGAAGYATGYIGKWHLAAGVQQGTPASAVATRLADEPANPEYDFVAPGPRRLGYQHWQAYNFHYNYHDYWYYEDEPEKRYSDRYETDTETDQAMAFMEQCRQSGRPFLVTVASHPPHPPFSPVVRPGRLSRTRAANAVVAAQRSHRPSLHRRRAALLPGHDPERGRQPRPAARLSGRVGVGQQHHRGLHVRSWRDARQPRTHPEDGSLRRVHRRPARHALAEANRAGQSGSTPCRLPSITSPRCADWRACPFRARSTAWT